ncbi:MAG: type IV pilin protein [Endomicrobiales bacterium]
MLKKAKGFTLIELVIVMVIIGILAAISVPIYRTYTRKAMASEGRNVVGLVAVAEKAYFAEHNAWVAVANSPTGDANISVNCQMNKYFTSFAVTTAGSGYTVTTTGTGDASGITVTYTQADTATGGSVTESGL